MHYNSVVFAAFNVHRLVHFIVADNQNITRSKFVKTSFNEIVNVSLQKNVYLVLLMVMKLVVISPSCFVTLSFIVKISFFVAVTVVYFIFASHKITLQYLLITT